MKTKQQLEALLPALREEHGESVKIIYEGGRHFAIKVVGGPLFERAFDLQLNLRTAQKPVEGLGRAYRDIAAAAIVADRDEALAFFSRRPGIAMSVGSTVYSMAYDDEENAEKKEDCDSTTLNPA